MEEVINSKLLVDVLGITKYFTLKHLEVRAGNLEFEYHTICDDSYSHDGCYNIHELSHKCILSAWDKMYEITPRVMGAEIMCLRTGQVLHFILREDIENPELFDPRFTFKAYKWILENKGSK